ncbi:unnamed protein product, partial [Iphiclides podalirius]
MVTVFTFGQCSPVIIRGPASGEYASLQLCHLHSWQLTAHWSAALPRSLWHDRGVAPADQAGERPRRPSWQQPQPQPPTSSVLLANFDTSVQQIRDWVSAEVEMLRAQAVAVGDVDDIAQQLDKQKGVLRELEQKKPQLDELLHTAESLKGTENRQQLHGKAAVDLVSGRNSRLTTASIEKGGGSTRARGWGARGGCGRAGVMIVTVWAGGGQSPPALASLRTRRTRRPAPLASTTYHCLP